MPYGAVDFTAVTHREVSPTRGDRAIPAALRRVLVARLAAEGRGLRGELTTGGAWKMVGSTGTLMLSGIFAIAGVVLGAALTFALQSVLARRTEQFTRAERLRVERLDVYSALAAQAMEARRAQINRWYQRRDAGRAAPQYAEAKAASYQSRAAARFERYRVQLVSPDTEMTTLAEAIVQSLGAIHKAESKQEMESQAEGTTTLIGKFVVAGAQDVASA